MNRSRRLYMALWVFLSVFSLSLSVGAAPGSSALRPNILFIMSDDHAQRAISAYDDSLVLTPNIDRIADEGAIFLNSFVTNSICTPSRAVLLTGKFSHRNGVRSNGDVFDGQQATFPRILQQQGYETVVVGKWHLSSDPDNIIHNPVPDSFNDDYAGRPAAEEADMRIADMFLSYDMKLRPDNYERETGSGGGRGHEEAVQEAVQAWQDAYARLSPAQKKLWDRFYDKINITYQQVRNDPEAFTDWMYQRYLHDYLATVRSVDRNIGRVLDYLDAEGLYENTIVIYTSDQGFYLGEHGWYDKRFMYEESMRTPLLIRYPAAIAAGRQIDQLVQNLDLAPTLLDFTGVRIPVGMQGLSLKKLATGKQHGTWRDSLYYHYYQYPGWHMVNPHYGIRSATHKLVHFYTKDHWELYDLEQDPQELYNRYNSPVYVQVRTQLHGQLRQLRNQYGDTTGGTDGG